MNSYLRLFALITLATICSSRAVCQESAATQTIAVTDHGVERIPRVVTGQPYSAVTDRAGRESNTTCRADLATMSLRSWQA
jgi:hypothetical protein